MRKLPQIQRGTAIADRYVVSEILRPWLVDFPERGSILLALDAILDVPRIVYVSPTEYSGPLLERAGRSALLVDPRVPAIEDAGTWNDFDYVVVERTGGTSLARILANGPLEAPVATAVVGELATVLTHAASRGLHHGVLGPESVAITSDGDIVVRGISLDAAVAQEPLNLGTGNMTASQLSQTDARALVAILYACLTGKWPGDQPRAGLDASGRKNNRILPVSHFVDTVPESIEEFASGVMGEQDPGPRSPSEVVRFLEPWDTRLLSTVDQSSRTEDELFSVRTHDPQTVVAPETGGEAKSDHSPGASPAQLAVALERIGLTRPGMHGAAAGVNTAHPDRYADRIQMRRASTFPIAPDKLPQVEEWSEERPQGPGDVSEADPHQTARILNRDDAFTDDGAEPGEAEGGYAQDSETDSSNDGLWDEPENDLDDSPESDATAESEDNSNDWFMGGVFQTREQAFARQQAEFERERQLERQARERAQQVQAAATSAATAQTGNDEAEGTREPENDSGSKPASAGSAGADSDGAGSVAAGSAEVVSAGEAGAAGATSSKVVTPARSEKVAESEPSGSSQTQSEKPEQSDKSGKRRFGVLFGVVAIIAALVLVGVVIVRSVGSGETTTASQENHEESQGEDQGEDKEAEDKQNEEEAEPPAPKEPEGPAPEINKATPLDPEGDGKEGNAKAKNLIPGEAGSWETDRYNSKEFGQLKKGVGIALELKERTTVKEVGVESEVGGGSFDILVGTDKNIDKAQKVGSGEFQKGKVTTVTIDDPAEATHVFIWIKELPKAGDGYRAVIPNVTLS
ncbi:hypothetical protein QP868_04250 [Brevibacterium sp. UMB1308A]|uniref:hypothetical protein n=1 Tax=Brevibacterium sp. UMB1308A TaxID=3050608 RepID=UPI00254FFABB|nr:hypothetical protein [Brevibacterium sp. UMB1308A]MDK8346103.1 hypothetical protein [Brevibacterium sp. UMB1308B]MDK8713106.1 hypothetical protein [Brevibacterium sp. UMB1308A]